MDGGEKLDVVATTSGEGRTDLAGNTTSMHAHGDAVPHQPPAKAIFSFYLILFLMMGAQSVIFAWKKKHKRSYELATLVGLWLIPPYLALQMSAWRFLTAWAAYSAVTWYWLWRCSAKRLSSNLPRQIFGWFLGVYRCSVVAGLAGYVLVVLQIFDPVLLTSRVLPAGLPATLVWYGLYFGVLGRDAAEVVSDRMAAVMGTGRRLAVSIKNCGMCNGDLQDHGVPADQVPEGSRTITLPCRHSFHYQCLQGWTIVGKKDSCPQCLEKVDLKALYGGRPWDTSNLHWIQMLDALRYMVVWLPLILMGAHVVLHVTGLEPDKPQPADAGADAAAGGDATQPELVLAGGGGGG